METVALREKRHISVEVDNNHLYHINGVKVMFPVKPYPSQISIMNKILHGIDQQKNCLLESPTGSGKSLALLCSCLAWQKAQKEKSDKNECHVKSTSATPVPGSVLNQEEGETSVPVKDKQETTSFSPEQQAFLTDDEDFLPAAKRTRRSITSTVKQKKKQRVKKTEEVPELKPNESNWKMEVKDAKENIEKDLKNEKNKEPRDKLPKIYFGTRTHKQIGQIVRELRKTAYKDIRMSILGSREYMCVHPNVAKSRDKNEECKQLLKGYQGKSCRYHANYHNLAAKNKFNAAWDVEDLVTLGKKTKGCPYYASRELFKHADIIFCPYNYLIDPQIRNQMMINLKDQIVVLDEAHNIEDSAREAASVQLTTLQLEDTKKDLEDMIQCGVMVNSHKSMLLLCNGMLEWIEKVKDSLDKRGFEMEAKVWSGREMVVMLSEDPARITSFALSLYRDELQKLTSEEQEVFNSGNDSELPRINTKSLITLSSLLYTLEKLFDQSNDYASDYRVGLSRTSVMRPVLVSGPGGWMRKTDRAEKVWTYKLNLWCLNPAVVFSEVGDLARTIILTSGTLSPMKTFSSELGVKFPISLEANHVINDSQVWVGNIGIGPNNIAIKANYQNSETFAFKDEVGKTVLQICKVIPKGVLCFLPSYSMMEKLINRWKMTGLWDELCACKVVHSEPRASDKIDFDGVLLNYYEAVNTSYKSKTGNCLLNGALLFAVCRGKVSEGLDFSDDNARAVIVVGIPFPNVKDIQVELKRKYNNSNVNRGLLNGSEWYEMQAFRALNQAVGRCIRHRNDWGAIIMVDQRFQNSPKYREGLSKWVRGKFQVYSDFQVCLSSLIHFVDCQINGHKDSKASVGMIPNRTPSTEYNEEVRCTRRKTFSSTDVYNDCLANTVKESREHFSVKPEMESDMGKTNIITINDDLKQVEFQEVGEEDSICMLDDDSCDNEITLLSTQMVKTGSEKKPPKAKQCGKKAKSAHFMYPGRTSKRSVSNNTDDLWTDGDSVVIEANQNISIQSDGETKTTNVNEEFTETDGEKEHSMIQEISSLFNKTSNYSGLNSVGYAWNEVSGKKNNKKEKTSFEGSIVTSPPSPDLFDDNEETFDSNNISPGVALNNIIEENTISKKAADTSEKEKESSRRKEKYSSENYNTKENISAGPSGLICRRRKSNSKSKRLSRMSKPTCIRINKELDKSLKKEDDDTEFMELCQNTEATDEEEAGVKCPDCGILLHKSTDLYSQPFKLPKEMTSRRSTSVYKVTSLDRNLITRRRNDRAKDSNQFLTNAFYDSAACCMYFPLYCLLCWKNNEDLLVGFQLQTFPEGTVESFLFETNA